MPHRKITVEQIESETNPERRWRLAKAAWFRHAMRLDRLTEMLDRMLNPTAENAHIQVESPYTNDVEALRGHIDWHTSQRIIYGDLWALHRSGRGRSSPAINHRVSAPDSVR